MGVNIGCRSPSGDRSAGRGVGFGWMLGSTIVRSARHASAPTARRRAARRPRRPPAWSAPASRRCGTQWPKPICAGRLGPPQPLRRQGRVVDLEHHVHHGLVGAACSGPLKRQWPR
jgi:hypothetical protein